MLTNTNRTSYNCLVNYEGLISQEYNLPSGLLNHLLPFVDMGRLEGLFRNAIGNR